MLACQLAHERTGTDELPTCPTGINLAVRSWAYFAVVLSLFARKPVGWTMSLLHKHTVPIVTMALPIQTKYESALKLLVPATTKRIGKPILEKTLMRSQINRLVSAPRIIEIPARS